MTPTEYAEDRVKMYRDYWDLPTEQAKGAVLIEMHHEIKEWDGHPVLICYFKQVIKAIKQ